jgi:PAS domain-containing protein
LFNSSKITIAGEEFFLVIVNDINDLKEADNALQRDRTILQELMDNTSALIYAIDMQRRIIVANKAFGDLLDRKPSEIIGKKRRQFLLQEIARHLLPMTVKSSSSVIPWNVKSVVHSMRKKQFSLPPKLLYRTRPAMLGAIRLFPQI